VGGEAGRVKPLTPKVHVGTKEQGLASEPDQLERRLR